MCILKKQTASAWGAWASDGPPSFTRVMEADKVRMPPERPTGSTRRKLWQLSPQAACPVVGVCLRLPDLERLARKVGVDTRDMSEYELHITVVSECKKRTPLAEEVQRELESRFSLLVEQAKKIKGTKALGEWCSRELTGAQLAGALWTTLTHARCTEELEYELLGRVHMIQHQVGMVVRADHSQLESLTARSAQLNAELQQARDRLAAQSVEWSARQQAWSMEEGRLRVEAASLNAALSRALNEVELFTRAIPDLGQRMALSESNAQLRSEVRALRRELARCRHDPADAGNGCQAGLAPGAEEREAPRSSPCGQPALLDGSACCPALRNRTVLCVGGRASSVPVYREIVEHKGARFLHHDGGEEDSFGRLSSDLTAADLVLCQVGCIGHNAYWRVKEHCKRYNKPCVFLKTPSRTALERALNVLDGDAVPVAHCPGERG